MPKVSVIIPIYKAEKYIEKCAVSLFEQTLDDLEYIFVNDGTPDSSIDILESILERYPNRKPCVKIIHKENGGLSSARTQGILEASGEYMIHCDSDDWVDKNLYENLYVKAVQSGAEVVVCPVIEELEKKSFYRNFRGLGNDCQEILKKWHYDCIQMYTVNKLVKSSIFKEHHLLPYKDINMWEDNGLMIRVFYYAKGFAQIDDASYHYNRVNECAITHGYGRNSINQMIQCAKYLYDFFESKNDFKEYYKTALAIKFFARVNLVTTSFKDLKEYYQLYKESDAVIPYIGKNAFSSKGYIRFCFVKYHLAWLFVLLFKFKSCIKK